MPRQATAIQILSAPSILGLRPSGVEQLAGALLGAGLAEKVRSTHPVLHIPTLNHLYSPVRDAHTRCLNTSCLCEFSLTLAAHVVATARQEMFALTLGGDCSILIGAMAGLASLATCGLIFIDAHADFYEPEKSVTGEAADMDLAIVTGRGPAMLTNIHHLRPYVLDKHVIHVGQRDWQETRQYGSQDIRETAITCFDLEAIQKQGMDTVADRIRTQMQTFTTMSYWVHFDTDVLADNLNPAVDYRLPGGLTFEEAETLLSNLLATGLVKGMSITIFNPTKDETGEITRNLTNTLARALTINPR